MFTKELFLAGFKFEGPFLTSERCKPEPGILVILRLHPDPDQGLEITNIYQSANLQASASLELSFFDGSAMVAALYTDRSSPQMSSNLARLMLTYLSGKSSCPAS